MKKDISIYALLLFIIPVITLFICQQIVAYYHNFYTIPFIDGKASISMMGRGEKTIDIFKSGFFLYIFISILFYFKISIFFLSKKIENKFKIFGLIANSFLCIYIISIGKDGSMYEALRRLAIIFYIVSIYISHIYLIKILKLLKHKKKIKFNSIYTKTFFIIIFLMTLLIIIGSPWVDPFFEYPNKLKNIIEWNYFLLTIIFYLPLSFIFYKSKNK
tara:strand:- start:398 stop:1048 length:651 start_codon:yes stop_codon:yes gene_type:complete